MKISKTIYKSPDSAGLEAFGALPRRGGNPGGRDLLLIWTYDVTGRRGNLLVPPPARHLQAPPTAAARAGLAPSAL